MTGTVVMVVSAVALVVVGLLAASAMRREQLCPPPSERPDLWGTHDAYVEAVLARGRRREAAEARARRLRMTALEVRRAGDVAAGPPVPETGSGR